MCSPKKQKKKKNIFKVYNLMFKLFLFELLPQPFVTSIRNPLSSFKKIIQII